MLCMGVEELCTTYKSATDRKECLSCKTGNVYVFINPTYVLCYPDASSPSYVMIDETFMDTYYPEFKNEYIFTIINWYPYIYKHHEINIYIDCWYYYNVDGMWGCYDCYSLPTYTIVESTIAK